MSNFVRLLKSVAVVASFFCSLQTTAITLNGTTDIHDPSTILKDGDTYWTFGTGGAPLRYRSMRSIQKI